MQRQVRHWNYRDLERFPCPDAPEVCDLYLKGNRIEELPQDPVGLDHLVELYLTENRIRVFPDGMCSLTNLTRLDLAGNCLESLPEAVYKLQNLGHLVLNDNQLTHLPLSLQNMTNLRTVNVDDNKLLWLPHKIGKNFYSTHVSFLRNKSLHQIPFTVWLHLLKDEKVPPGDNLCYAENNLQYKEKIANQFKLLDMPFTVMAPPQMLKIESFLSVSAPTLYELCLREICKRSSDYKIEDLPQYLIRNILCGPTAYCDLPRCKRPLFGHALMAITIGSVGKEDKRNMLISCFFCSKTCCKMWSDIFRMQPLEWSQTS